jgi:hypothetical protein
MVEGAFNDVAVLVVLDVVVDGSAAVCPSVRTVADLVRRFGDDRLDATGS